MAESGCLKDGHFQNLEVEGITSLSRKDFKPVSTSLTLTKNDCGIIFLDGSDSPNGSLNVESTINLPSPETGLHFKFILNASLTSQNGSFVISTSDNASFVGSINCSGTLKNSSYVNGGEKNIVFGNGSLPGDFVDLTCYKSSNLKRWHTFGNTGESTGGNASGVHFNTPP